MPHEVTRFLVPLPPRMALTTSRRQEARSLNDDVLRHIANLIGPTELSRVKSANSVFYYEHMRISYTSLDFDKRTKKAKKLLLHLSDRDADVARWVRRVEILPWLVEPRTKSPRSRTERLIILCSKLLDPHYTEKVAQRRLSKRLGKDTRRILSAFQRMENIEEYEIGWNDNSQYHPELYQVLIKPVLDMWSPHLTKLTIKLPPPFLNSLAQLRLPALKTFCYSFSTGNLSFTEIDHIHTGFIVFVNNLKDSLESLSFMSTNTCEHLDLGRVFVLLGTFPMLRSISVSIPYDGGHLPKPIHLVQFLERHRRELRELNLFTNRITVRKEAGHPRMEWIQRVLEAILIPFPHLRTLGVALRPVRHPMETFINFLEMHTSLNTLKLMDRSLSSYELSGLFRSPAGKLIAEGLVMLHMKVDVLSAHFLAGLSRRFPNLEVLEIECQTVAAYRPERPRTGYRHLGPVSYLSSPVVRDAIENWKLQQLSLGLPDFNWAKLIDPYLKENLPHIVPVNLLTTRLPHGQIIY